MTDPLYLTVEHIARVCHESNRAYCMSVGDHSQPTWDMAPQWQRESAIEGVRAVVADPNRQPEDSHVSWMVLKESQGWAYGPVKAPELKQHPCMVPYAELPEIQKVKDHLFLAVARTLREYTFDVKSSPSAANVPVPEGDGEMLYDTPVATDVTDDELKKKRPRRKKGESAE